MPGIGSHAACETDRGSPQSHRAWRTYEFPHKVWRYYCEQKVCITYGCLSSVSKQTMHIKLVARASIAWQAEAGNHTNP